MLQLQGGKVGCSAQFVIPNASLQVQQEKNLLLTPHCLYSVHSHSSTNAATLTKQQQACVNLPSPQKQEHGVFLLNRVVAVENSAVDPKWHTLKDVCFV